MQMSGVGLICLVPEGYSKTVTTDSYGFQGNLAIIATPRTKHRELSERSSVGYVLGMVLRSMCAVVRIAIMGRFLGHVQAVTPAAIRHSTSIETVQFLGHG